MSAHVPMSLKNFLPDDSCDGAPGSKGIPLYEQNPAVPSHFLPPLFFMFPPAALLLWAVSQEILTHPGTHSKFGADGLREVFLQLGPGVF